MRVSKYSELRVWQDGMDLVEQVYRFTEGFPRSERYALTSQIRKAAVSIPSNIAEGHARFHTREFSRFVTIALGSLVEQETQLELGRRLHFLLVESHQQLKDKTDSLGRQLQSLRKTLERKLSAKLTPSP